MANSLTLAEKYLKILDAKMVKDSTTSILEASNEMTKGFDEAGTIKIMSMIVKGLGNYTKDGGSSSFPAGGITTTWESYTIDNDRAQSFTVDAVDDEESMNMVFVNAVKLFMDEWVIPEIDATRYATMASLAGTSVEETKDETTILLSLDTATQTLDEENVPSDGRVLFVNNEYYKYLKNNNKITRNVSVEGDGAKTINRNIEMFDDMKIIKVPQSRFYTAIDLEDGTGDVWGYSKGALGRNINFIMAHPSYTTAITRHVTPRVFPARINQDSDGDKFQYRIYHDTIVPVNKRKSIYVSYATA